MSKQIIIAEQHRIAAVFADDQIEELVVAQGSHQIGDIYLGLVENVLPSIDAAFVNIGDRERNGFIHVTDLGPLRLRRSAGAITELLEPQQKVLVQVMKEPTGSKGPRLTGNLSLPGRYLVLMPFRKGVNLSRRISSEAERSRLRALAILVKPAGMGLLVRTEAEGVAEEAIIEDLEFLQNQWATVQEEALSTRPPALLNRDDDFIQRVLRDVFTGEVNRIVVDSSHGLKRVKQHLMTWSSGRMPQGVFIDQHRERTSILEYFRVDAAIREALKPRVDLPSGGYIIIEPTEALTVIDVNSGSFTRSATARETVLWTNCEAATEISRQLRLRNLAGVIVVDFIDMESRRDQLHVLKHFEEALKLDKARPQIAQLSELGLVELTRKRQGQNLYELFGQVCSHCGGLGHLLQIPGMAPVSIAGIILPNVVDLGYGVPEARGSRSGDLLGAGGESWSNGDAPWSGEEEEESSGVPSLASEAIYDAPTVLRGDREESTPSLSPIPNRRRRRRVGDNGGPEFLPEVETPSPVIASDRTPVIVSDRAPVIVSDRVLRVSEPSPDGSEGSSSVDVAGRLNRRPRSPVRPAEVITVEMTPLQKEVYAWIGVSPLVLMPELLESDRNLVVHVVDPGEGSPVPEQLSLTSSLPAPVPKGNEEQLLVADRDEEDAPPWPRPVLPQEPEIQDDQDDRAMDAQVMVSPANDPDPEPTPSPTPSLSPSPKDEPELLGARRRRRRSSALKSDDDGV